eukprot:scaffold153931_cov20-Tisochrysis_lutea.AAC.1
MEYLPFPSFLSLPLILVCHPCTGNILIFSASFQFRQQTSQQHPCPHLAVNTRVDAVKHAGHAEEHGGLQGGDVIHQLAHVSLPVADGAAQRQEPLLNDSAGQPRGSAAMDAG